MLKSTSSNFVCTFLFCFALFFCFAFPQACNNPPNSLTVTDYPYLSSSESGVRKRSQKKNQINFFVAIKNSIINNNEKILSI